MGNRRFRPFCFVILFILAALVFLLVHLFFFRGGRTVIEGAAQIRFAAPSLGDDGLDFSLLDGMWLLILVLIPILNLLFIVYLCVGSSESEIKSDT